MKWFRAFFFLVCLNMSFYVLAASQFYPVTIPGTYQPLAGLANLLQPGATNMTQLNLVTWLSVSLTPETLLGMGIGGLLASVLAIFTRSYVFAVIILVLWCITMIAPVLQWAVGGVMLIMQAANVPLPWQMVIDGLIFLIFFMGILEIAVQRPISQ